MSREPSTVNDIIDIIEDDQAHEEESATDSAACPSKSVGKMEQAESEFFLHFSIDAMHFTHNRIL